MHPGLSARNNLLALARTSRIGRRRVEEVIELAGLGEVAERGREASPSVWDSASAWRRRCWGQPQTVVLDEPVNGFRLVAPDE